MSQPLHTSFDIVVVGGGVFGVWAAIAAAKRGAAVALVDQFEPPHKRGSSHGDGRIYRVAYTEDRYVDLMIQSIALWKELEKFLGHQLLAQTGFLSIGHTIDGRSCAETRGLIDLYQRRGIEYQLLSAAATSKRFPQFRLHNGLEALHIFDGGALFASKSVAAAWKYAASLGVVPITGFRAVELHRCEKEELRIVSSDGRSITGKKIIFAVGAWLSTIGSEMLRLDIPTRVSAETVCYYAPRQDENGQTASPDHSYHSMPPFMMHTDNGLSAYGYYGLPKIDIPGIKVSAHYCGPIVDPDRRPCSAGGDERQSDAEEVSAAERTAAIVESTNKVVAETFPFVNPVPIKTESCLYTCTPDHDFVIGSAPGWNNKVVVVGAGSGHGFKMGPAVGECAACLALGDKAPVGLESFSVERSFASDYFSEKYTENGARVR